jgi:hypothetical protein
MTLDRIGVKKGAGFSTFLRGCNPALFNKAFQISPLSWCEVKTIL